MPRDILEGMRHLLTALSIALAIATATPAQAQTVLTFQASGCITASLVDPGGEGRDLLFPSGLQLLCPTVDGATLAAVCQALEPGHCIVASGTSAPSCGGSDQPDRRISEIIVTANPPAPDQDNPSAPASSPEPDPEEPTNNGRG